MEKLLAIVENFSLAFVLGGGIVMSACVRPLLLKVIAPGVQQSVVNVIDDIRVHSWQNYNRTALFAAVIVVAVQGVRTIDTGYIQYVPLIAASLIVLALARKLVIDQRLEKRLTQGLPAHGSSVDDNEQKELAFWTICVLILALVLTIYLSLLY